MAPSYLQSKTHTPQLHGKNHSISRTILSSPICHYSHTLSCVRQTGISQICTVLSNAPCLYTLQSLPQNSWLSLSIFIKTILSQDSFYISAPLCFPWPPKTEYNSSKFPVLNVSSDMNVNLIHTVVIFFNSSLKDSLPYGVRILILFTAVWPATRTVPYTQHTFK